jgi:lactate permease
MPWEQIYDPLNNPFLSTLAAFLPAVLLLGSLGLLRLKAHAAAWIGLISALLVAVLVYRMPTGMAAAAALYGMAYGFLPIGWIILNLMFLFRLTEEKGLFQTLQQSLTSVTRDRRLQLILVAFCFGAFLEGAAGFGTPVAVSTSILTGLGFPALSAAGLSLIANTAPVPYAGLGTPLVALQTVTGLDLRALTANVAIQMTLFDLLIPFWLAAAFCGLAAALEIWPALLVAGLTFGLAQLLVALFHGPWLVNIISSLVSLAALIAFLRVWKPARIWRFPGEDPLAEAKAAITPRAALRAWAPWLLLSVVLFIWGLPQVKTWLDSFSLLKIHVPLLDGLVLRMPPVLPKAQAQPAVFDLAWLSASGTGILLAALLAGLGMGMRPLELLRAYATSFLKVRYSLLTILTMMSIGFVARYAGMDGTMGLAFARTGPFYPFFGALLGWLGVAITGSDTSSNVLFGSLQRITAGQLGIDPTVMAAANSSGGVMGKMVNTQSIVVGAAAAGQTGKESELLRYVFFHSLALVALVGLVVMAMIYL